MPSRRHTKSPPAATPAGAAAPSAGRDPAEMFAAALKESEARDRAQRDRDRQQKDAAAKRAADAAAQADALKEARRDLDRAIRDVRDAKAAGRSTVDADARWKVAKARVIELETGEAPSWAPATPEPSPLDDGAVGEE